MYEEELTPQQIMAIEYLSSPEYFHLTLDDVAEKIGVCRKTLYNWRQERLFRQACHINTRMQFRDARRQIDHSLIQLACDGNIQAKKLYYKIAGYWDEARTPFEPPVRVQVTLRDHINNPDIALPQPGEPLPIEPGNKEGEI